MSDRNNINYFEVALDSAQRAGKLIMDFHNRRVEPIWTSPTHFKTEADDASEQLIREAIIEHFPDHNICSEETALLQRGSRFTWVCDAVDGTINLRTGITDHFSVCIALCEGTTPIIGIVNAVKRGELYTAEIGKGAFCNGLPIKVSELENINQVLMGVDSGKHERTNHLPYLEKLLVSEGINYAFSTGCASVPLCFVASGVMHAYLATSLEPEDVAAAVCLIREAGGKVTNSNGLEWKLGDSSILAANPVLHKKLSEMLGLGR